MDNALSKTKYYSGLVLNQEGTKNIKMTLQQSTENDFQPTTGGHSTKFTCKILLKGTCNDSKWIKCILRTGNYHTWARKNLCKVCAPTKCVIRKNSDYMPEGIFWGKWSTYTVLSVNVFITFHSHYSLVSMCIRGGGSPVGNKIRISWQ